jgi:hypothetical protein
LRAGAPAYLAGRGAQRRGRQLLSIPLACSRRSKIGFTSAKREDAVTGVWGASMDWAPLVNDYERGARSTAQRNKP